MTAALRPQMEVYAGALHHADYEIGRIMDAIKESGQTETRTRW
jgi:arylsulfatase A-like enzyme